MGHQITLNIPDAVYQRAHQIAKRQGVQLENVLVDVLNAHWFSTDALLTDGEKLAAVTSSVESTGWWDVDGDKEWDEWTP